MTAASASAWGAKTIPSGGYWSMPKRLSVPGMVIAGDAASMVNVPELKGIHYAMHAGMYAAEAIVAALKQDSVNFEEYERRVKKSVIEEDIWRSRNMRQPFEKGFFVGAHRQRHDDHPWALSGRPLEEPPRRHPRDGDRRGSKSYPKADNSYI